MHVAMDLNEFFSDTSVNKPFQSKIPELALKEGCILGVDEAGRGPVLGPMVYGICYCPLQEVPRLNSMKFADSKTLSEEQRENLFEEINSVEFLGWMTEVIAPNMICNYMLRRAKYNLNAVSHDAAISLIQRTLDANVIVKEIYVDTVGDPGKYQNKLSELFPGIKVTVAKKADSTYPIVSAASICAKVSRDRILKQWKFKEKIDIQPDSWGSGYPNDPVTKSFLKESLDPVFGFTQLVRFSWSTADKLLEEKAVKVEWEDVDEEGSPATVSSSSLLSFFQRTPSSQKTKGARKPHAFFTDRCLTNATTL